MGQPGSGTFNLMYGEQPKEARALGQARKQCRERGFGKAVKGNGGRAFQGVEQPERDDLAGEKLGLAVFFDGDHASSTRTKSSVTKS